MSKTAKERRDEYYALAKQEKYRARSAYKLLEINEYLDDILNVEVVVDLCAAPGSWSQVLAKRASKVISVDLAPIAPISENVYIIQGDITSEETADEVIELANGKVSAVVSDGAPDVTGLHDLDEYVQAELIEAAFGISQKILKTGGFFIAKIFRGELTPCLLQEMSQYFGKVMIIKPAASRASSMEAFLVCMDKYEATGEGEIVWDVECCGMEGPDSDKTYE